MPLSEGYVSLLSRRCPGNNGGWFKEGRIEHMSQKNAVSHGETLISQANGIFYLNTSLLIKSKVIWSLGRTLKLKYLNFIWKTLNSLKKDKSMNAMQIDYSLVGTNIDKSDQIPLWMPCKSSYKSWKLEILFWGQMKTMWSFQLQFWDGLICPIKQSLKY